MNIAILTSSLPPYTVGGAEHQAVETARRLARRGHEITVFARRTHPDQPLLLEEDGVRWVTCPSAPVHGLSFAAHAVSFARAWRRYGGARTEVTLAYQLVINGFLGAFAARPPAPLVSWVRSELEIRLSRSRKYRLLSPAVLARSRRVLVQAETIADEMTAEFARVRGSQEAARLRERIAVLPNAIELGPEPSYSQRRDLGFLGRLVPEKGLEVLLEALRLMPSPPKLHVFGDGPLRRTMEARAEGLPVVFAGRVAREDVAGRLATLRVLAAPSHTEGFPNAILEAMERGVPAVATDVGGIHEVVRDGVTGYLVPPGDARALAARLATILGDDVLWERLARGAREAAGGYAWDAHIVRLEQVLAEAAAETRPA